MGGERWGFDGEAVSFDLHRRLQEAGLSLVPTSGMVLGLRMVKDREEIAKLRRACAIAADALEEAFDRIRPGMTEREAALWLEVRMREMGAEGPAFPFIVASGPRGSLPHATAGSRALAPGDMVTFDVGCRYFGYHSDITRTVALGRPSPELQEVYELVRRAQEAGIAAVRPGVRARDIDAAARQVIVDGGYGERFGHGTGHGVGLEIHEWPRLSSRSDDELRAGMVLTVEPGIYLPGLGGVRIEDTVLVTEDGAQILTVSPKSLRML
jgi:Xaa-Pro aminopeptidase